MDPKRYFQLIEEAARIVSSKGEDYQGNAVQLHDYFPFGDKSYVQMLHTKTTRLVSLAHNKDMGIEPNHESIRDSVWDLINYAVFYLDYLDMEEQDRV